MTKSSVEILEKIAYVFSSTLRAKGKGRKDTVCGDFVLAYFALHIALFSPSKKSQMDIKNTRKAREKLLWGPARVRKELQKRETQKKRETLLCAFGRQNISTRRTAPQTVFTRAPQRSNITFKDRSPGPRYALRTSFGPACTDKPSFSFGEGREFMYDRRKDIDENKLGPGEYASNSTSSFGDQYTSKKSTRPAITINVHDCARRPYRLGEEDIPGPASYVLPVCEVERPRSAVHSFGETFVRVASRPPWSAALKGLHSQKNDEIGRTLLMDCDFGRRGVESSIGKQSHSTKRSFPSYRFGNGSRRGPETWRSDPDAIIRDVYPGVGHYARSTAIFAVGKQRLSQCATSPSYGFSKASRFGKPDPVYYEHGDCERRGCGIRRRGAAARNESRGKMALGM